MDYADEHDIPIEQKRGRKRPTRWTPTCSHISFEGGMLEDPWTEPPSEMWRWSVSPEMAPDEATYLELTFEKGDIVAIDGKAMSPAEVLTELNRVGGAHGVGRVDIVENRFVGMKTPRRLRDPRRHDHADGASRDRVDHPRPRGRRTSRTTLMPRYAELIYNGFWFTPEREMLQAAIDHEPATRQRRRCASSSTRATCHVAGRKCRRLACSTRRSPPSRRTRAPTTRPTPRASSSSTPCACGPCRKLRLGRGRGTGPCLRGAERPLARPLRGRPVRGAPGAERLVAVRSANVS